MPGDSPGLRLNVLGIVAVSLLAVLLSRLVYPEVMEAPHDGRVAVLNQAREIVLRPTRGRILGRDGRILADNARTLTVSVDRGAVKVAADRAELFARLAGPLKTTVAALEERFKD